MENSVCDTLLVVFEAAEVREGVVMKAVAGSLEGTGETESAAVVLRVERGVVVRGEAGSVEETAETEPVLEGTVTG